MAARTRQARARHDPAGLHFEGSGFPGAIATACARVQEIDFPDSELPRRAEGYGRSRAQDRDRIQRGAQMSIGGLWNRISSAFERSDIGMPDAAQDDEHADLIRPTPTRYAPIRKAVERRVTAFLREDLVSHLEIGFNEVFVLHYIEIAADGQGAADLDHFLEEFSPQARVQWVKKLLGPAVGKHVSLGQFLGLDKEFPTEALAETDPFEDKLNQAAVALYRV